MMNKEIKLYEFYGYSYSNYVFYYYYHKKYFSTSHKKNQKAE